MSTNCKVLNSIVTLLHYLLWHVMMVTRCHGVHVILAPCSWWHIWQLLGSVFVHVQYAFNICVLECYYFRNKVLFADICGSQDNYVHQLAFSVCMYVYVTNAHLCVEWMWRYTQVYKWVGSIHQREYLSHLCVSRVCVLVLWARSTQSYLCENGSEVPLISDWQLLLMLDKESVSIRARDNEGYCVML